MITGIEHIGLVAKDAPKLVQWLSDMLDMKVIRTIANGTTFFVQAPGGVILEVYPFKSEGERNYDNYTTGWRHLALYVENFEEEYDRLLQKGVEFLHEPNVTEERKLVLFKDCEGNLYHLVWRKDPLID